MVRIKKIPQTGLRIHAAMESPQRVLVEGSEKSLRLDMPELLGGANRGVMPLEALLAAYAGSLNVVGNFVAKTMDFDLDRWDFTIWAEFDPRGIYGLAKVKKAILVVHVEARVTTTEPERRLAQLRKTLAERDPVHNLLKSAGVRIREKWERVAPNAAGKKARKK
jgi:uncharacterized OsmC-like protein